MTAAFYLSSIGWCSAFTTFNMIWISKHQNQADFSDSRLLMTESEATRRSS